MSTLAGIRVLVVDDDPLLRLLLLQDLDDEGADVREARGGAEALALLAAGVGTSAAWVPNVILCDQRMPGMDGAAFAAAYRQRGGAAPILTMSAGASATDWDKFDLDVLRALLQRTVRSPQGAA